MNKLTTAGAFTGYLVASVAGLAILKRFLPEIALPLRGGTLPPMNVRLWLIVGIGLYMLSFALWLVILRALPLALAYPTAVGLTICGTTLISIFLLGERIHASQGIGIALIIVGVTLVYRGTL